MAKIPAIKKQCRNSSDMLGLLSKYFVLKREVINGVDRWVEKETPCFVLSPAKRGPYGKASRSALTAYARAIEKTNPTLAKEIRDWVVICTPKDPT